MKLKQLSLILCLVLALTASGTLGVFADSHKCKFYEEDWDRDWTTVKTAGNWGVSAITMKVDTNMSGYEVRDEVGDDDKEIIVKDGTRLLPIKIVVSTEDLSSAPTVTVRLGRKSYDPENKDDNILRGPNQDGKTTFPSRSNDFERCFYFNADKEEQHTGFFDNKLGLWVKVRAQASHADENFYVNENELKVQVIYE